MFNSVINFSEQKTKQQPRARRRKSVPSISINSIQRPGSGRRTISLSIPLSELKKAGLEAGDKVVLCGDPHTRLIGIHASEAKVARTLSSKRGEVTATVEFDWDKTPGGPSVPDRLPCSGALHGDRCLYFIGPKQTHFGKWVKGLADAR